MTGEITHFEVADLAPLAYHKVGLDQAVLDAFGIAPAPKPNMARWDDVKDHSWQSIFGREGAVEQRFAMCALFALPVYRRPPVH